MRITKSQLRQIIKEEADKVMKELESGGGLGNKELLAKFNDVNNKIMDLGKKEIAGTLTSQEKSEMQKLAKQHALILKMMFQPKTKVKSDIANESSGRIEESQYEAGSAGYHIQQARRMARELDELEKGMPNASGLGHEIEKELDIALEEMDKELEVMDNTIDYYKMQLRDLNEGFEDLGQEIRMTVGDIETGKSEDNPMHVAARFIDATLEELREKLSPILEPGDFDKALAMIINDDDEPEEADPDTATGEFIIGKG